MSTPFDENNPLWRAIAGSGSSEPRNSLADLIAPPPPSPFGYLASGMGSLLGTVQTKRRRVYFAFHYEDILRVNNVRLSGEFTQSGPNSGRDVEASTTTASGKAVSAAATMRSEILFAMA
jgi:hypothetical protein